MSSTRLTYRRAPYGTEFLGEGASSIVFKSIEVETGKTVALKMSRVSTRVGRPTLQHETRIIRLLKGHASIPCVHAYGQLGHFKYMAMEILGPSVAKQQKKNGARTEVIEPGAQLAGLEHIHSLGILHRDIKHESLLCGLDDSTIKIIDFGLSKPISHGPPNKYDPLKDCKTLVGSPYWASLHSHNGVDLAPRDDLESLAYIALFLLLGHLPWKPRSRLEPRVRSQEIIRLMKSSCSGKGLSSGFPVEFGDLLDYSCSIDFDQLPDYRSFRRLFTALPEAMSDGPLDWSPCDPQTTTCILDEPQLDIPGFDENSDPDDDDYAFAAENSYFEMDISMLERQRERDKDLLPVERELYLDSCTPLIVQVGRESC
ncbi:putative casein kinase-1 hhp1 [Armillaria borealis]|uniref:Casein kinase-1 hhp1 n=1 Tax=Armillaria borealis TaxID=47425 RepID=A0AA39J4Z6_9AGAR|nr:putative casein kinase-1 hhp1 [Armillaria borealis]